MEEVKKKNLGGRPSLFTKELADEICNRMKAGESLKKICEDSRMPHRDTVHQWLNDEDKKWFSDKYAKASDTRTENKFDEIEEIAKNEPDVARARLMVDTRKWYLSKIVPKKYGEKLDLTTGGEKLPTPILGYLTQQDAIPTNNSNTEDSSTEEAA